MIRYAITFFIIALVAAILGFGGVANLSADIGKTLLEVFVLLVVLGAIFGFTAGRGLFARR
jgi:uncharacterized membrane protein YtjA (UPF0391 family)